MIDNNPIFSKENIKRLARYISDQAYTLRYNANDTEDQYDAAEKLSLIKFLVAYMADHFFGYYPSSYFLSEVQLNPFKDFIDELKQYPEDVLDRLMDFADEAFDELDYIVYSESEFNRKPNRNEDIEEAITEFLEEISDNMEEFLRRLFMAPQKQDESKPSEEKIRGLINVIKKIQDYMLYQGEAHNDIMRAFDFSKMLEMFKLPLLFGWEKYNYGWHSDYWKEGDSIFEYDLFLFNASEHLNGCLTMLKEDSPFKYFDQNGQITSDLIDVISDISARLSSGEFKIT